ncbi:MAG: hypothetical protein ABIO39_00905 [Caulobacteraceae bacterium]
MSSLRNGPARTVITVSRLETGWAVEEGGEFYDRTPNKDEAKAAAHKRARAAQDAGRPCQVRVDGETGYFSAAT